MVQLVHESTKMTITHIVVENTVSQHNLPLAHVEVNYLDGSFRCLEAYYVVSNLDDVNLVLLDNGDDEVSEDTKITYH